MSRSRFYDVVQLTDANGFVKKVPNPEVTVYTAGTTTPLPDTLYAGPTGGTTRTNPFTGGANGEVEFYLDDPKTVSIKYDGAPTFGAATLDNQSVWPPADSVNSTIWSPDGTQSASVDNDGVFHAPGILRSLGRYNPEDHGAIPGFTSANKATNKAAIEAMLAEIGTNGGGDIVIGNNIPTDPIAFDHGGGGSRAITISGRNGEGGFQFYGTGPYLNIASTIGNRLDRCGIQDLIITHASTPSAHATIKLGYCFEYEIEGLRMLVSDDGTLPEDESSFGAFIGIEAILGFTMRRSVIQLRTDVSAMGAVTPIGVLFNGPDLTGGPAFYDSEISGSGVAQKSYGVRFAGAGFIDTPRMSRMIVKDHLRAMVCNSGGGFGNGIFSDLVLDGLNEGIFLSPAGPVSNNQFSNTWISAFAAALNFDEANGGSVDGQKFSLGYFTNSLTTCVNMAAGVSKVWLLGIDMPTSINTGGEYGILMGGVSGTADGHKVQGCTVEVQAGATAAARFSTASTNTNVSGNTFLGKAGIPGFTSGAGGNVYANNGGLG